LWSHGSTPTSQPFQIVIGSELESDWRPWGVVAVTVHVTVPLNRVGSWVLSGVKLNRRLPQKRSPTHSRLPFPLHRQVAYASTTSAEADRVTHDEGGSIEPDGGRGMSCRGSGDQSPHSVRNSQRLAGKPLGQHAGEGDIEVADG
jgi:hypothetical protein